MTYKFASTTLILALGLAACTKTSLPAELNGIWQSEGYGHIFQVQDSKATAYDATDKTCQKNEDTSEILDALLRAPGKLKFRQSGGGDAFYISQEFEPHETRYVKLDALPVTCEAQPQNTPMGNFDAFADYFASHYAFFDLYGVDWDASTAQVRKQITPETTDEQLFQILSGLIAPIKDGHVELNGVVGGEDRSFDPGQGKTQSAITAKAERRNRPRREISRETLRSYWGTGIKEEILGGKGTITGSNFIQYGMAKDDIGYIAFMAEFGYANREFLEEPEDLAALNTAMDDAISQFKAANAKAVIIDLSVNFGGYDFIGREIAGRFAKTKTLAYSKYAGDIDAGEKIVTDLYVEPAQGERFTGPVYLLTSDVTVSAGEILTMSLRALPNVTHTGEPTRGALSDVLDKQLPNGWTVTLSNEVYKDHEGILWEGKGIDPHLFIENYDAQNPTANHVGTVNALIDVINKEHP